MCGLGGTSPQFDPFSPDHVRVQRAWPEQETPKLPRRQDPEPGHRHIGQRQTEIPKALHHARG